jgi:hypothetical protein
MFRFSAGEEKPASEDKPEIMTVMLAEGRSDDMR